MARIPGTRIEYLRPIDIEAVKNLDITLEKNERLVFAEKTLVYIFDDGDVAVELGSHYHSIPTIKEFVEAMRYAKNLLVPVMKEVGAKKVVILGRHEKSWVLYRGGAKYELNPYCIGYDYCAKRIDIIEEKKYFKENEDLRDIIRFLAP